MRQHDTCLASSHDDSVDLLPRPLHSHATPRPNGLLARGPVLGRAPGEVSKPSTAVTDLKLIMVFIGGKQLSPKATESVGRRRSQ